LLLVLVLVLVLAADFADAGSTCSSASGKTHWPCWQIRSPLHCMSY
jgi:hypothetical protein